MGTEKKQNILFCIHEELGSFQEKFRERVCLDCNWSAPTYYRKMRSASLPGSGRKNSCLSNAEREKIISIRKEIFREITEEIGNESISYHWISF
ncbi:hypothetical protein [Chitinophaga flava]|uniref:Uncharacterized protein n=1 Tax=Chitinophaga flava TaxID=2259036 RepID=A0A365XVP4_9BACT|nr:hypothetical protein [Chitinophaga flava]RBL90446.1 hypothetical protein DF182_28720 [Chitinophaga flava]